jgi:HAD superfamily hydrolase (TIGR01549 family)
MPKQPRFKAIIFDMDGTITVPAIDFKKIRDELGIETGDILPIIESWPEKKRQYAWQLIERYENEVRANTQFQPNAPEVLREFQKAGIFIGILTRNTWKSVNVVLDLLQIEFDAILTREYEFVKPAPEPVLHILEKWGLDSSDALVVGDYIHDLECGKAAGASSCFFKNPDTISYEEFADFTVESYVELKKLVFGNA